MFPWRGAICLFGCCLYFVFLLLDIFPFVLVLLDLFLFVLVLLDIFLIVLVFLDLFLIVLYISWMIFVIFMFSICVCVFDGYVAWAGGCISVGTCKHVIYTFILGKETTDVGRVDTKNLVLKNYICIGKKICTTVRMSSINDGISTIVISTKCILESQ